MKNNCVIVKKHRLSFLFQFTLGAVAIGHKHIQYVTTKDLPTEMRDETVWKSNICHTMATKAS